VKFSDELKHPKQKSKPEKLFGVFKVQKIRKNFPNDELREHSSRRELRLNKSYSIDETDKNNLVFTL
jgi:hypothetical protein